MQLSRKEIDEMYGTRRIGRDQAASLVGLMDLFCFSEVNFSNQEEGGKVVGTIPFL